MAKINGNKKSALAGWLGALSVMKEYFLFPSLWVTSFYHAESEKSNCEWYINRSCNDYCYKTRWIDD